MNERDKYALKETGKILGTAMLILFGASSITGLVMLLIVTGHPVVAAITGIGITGLCAFLFCFIELRKP